MRHYGTKDHSVRYVFIAAFFCVVCLIFAIALAVVKIIGPQQEYLSDGDYIIKTVTVSGLRGEIYDRNGKLLVGNATTYDLIFEYGSMPDTHNEINVELLEAIEAIEKTDNKSKLAEDLYPIDGMYPNVRYVSAVENPSSEHAKALASYLEKEKLPSDTSAFDLAEYIMYKHKISEKKYTPAQIRSLSRLWYEMDRSGFGAFQSYTIAKDVNMELVTYIGEKGIDGANFITMSTRVYNYPGIASHILGRLGKITAETSGYYSELGYPLDSYVGTSGCELAFESILHGQDGTMVIKYDRDGNIVEKYYEKQPISGNDVWLTIDIDLQIAAENGLESATKNAGASKGAITAIDPNTGAVLAIASYPTYDLSSFASKEYYNSLLENPDLPLLNRALSGSYAPGSTYKVGVALAALENGTISNPEISILTTTEDGHDLSCNVYYARFDHPKCLGSHGRATVYEAIQDSCNIFFYELGYIMGTESITRYTKGLGLGSETGIELAESVGHVAGTNVSTAWSKSNDVKAAIGQADHVYTPLQLSVYMASIVNGGDRYSAHLFDSERNFYTKEAISAYTPTVAEKVRFSDSTYDVLIESMRLVVTKNLSTRFKNVKYSDGTLVAVGGKTGTAEVAGQKDNALFSGFAPLDDPEIVVSCIIEEGAHGYNASNAVAAVMQEYFKNKEQK